MKYDIIIKNGVVIDGTGAKPRESVDIGIAGDKIAFIGRLNDENAGEVIDAKGAVVSPGFIDIHGHSDYFILIEPMVPNKLRQGVTTEIGGNCGYSSAPVSSELNEERGASLFKNFGLKPDWLTLREYHERLEKVKIGINFASLIGHNTVRASVMGGEARPPEQEEMERMKSLIRQGMAEGALGISAGLIYPPSCFADSDELAEVCKLAKDGFFAVHMRSEGNRLVEAVSEVVDVARKADIRLEISHLKTSGQRNWKKLDEVLAIIEGARNDGVDVRCDRYPYTSSFTGLSATLPVWAFEGTREEFRHRLEQPEVRNRIRREMASDHPEGDYLEKVTIAQTFSEKTKWMEGKSVAECARMAGSEPLDFLLHLLATEESDPTAIYHTMSEDNMRRILSLPYCVIGSDSASRAPGPPLGVGKPHPRAYGCFPRFLQIVLAEKLMPIESAIAKMTGETAKNAGLEKRGTLAVGNFADIVVFFPEKVRDNATYDNPHQFASGFECVIVNGKIAVREDEFTGVRNGMVIKKTSS